MSVDCAVVGRRLDAKRIGASVRTSAAMRPSPAISRSIARRIQRQATEVGHSPARAGAVSTLDVPFQLAVRGSSGAAAALVWPSAHSSQSSPNSSHGCCVRIVPLPQARSSAGQYLSHPQQMRSGCGGRSGIFDIVALIRR